MFEQIIDYLVSKIQQSGYFEQVFSMVELIVNGEGKIKPAQYTGKGQYEDVNNFDNYNGIAYFREKDAQNVQQITSINGVPCKEVLQITYNLRMVACIPKSKLKHDDMFTDERVSKTLMSLIVNNGGVIKSAINARSLTSIPYSVIKDNQRILREEYSGYNKLKDINYNLSYHAIDFYVTVQIDSSCVVTECQEYYV